MPRLVCRLSQVLSPPHYLKRSDASQTCKAVMQIKRARAKIEKARLLAPCFLEPLANNYFCGRLAGGMMLFIRRYSTIWP